MEGSWFVEYFIDDLKTDEFTLLLNEDGTGKKNGSIDVIWKTNKKDLSLIINEIERLWENNRNKKNTQFYLTNDEDDRFLRMEMERIK